jgi:hypothetical protein
MNQLEQINKRIRELESLYSDMETKYGRSSQFLSYWPGEDIQGELEVCRRERDKLKSLTERDKSKSLTEQLNRLSL